jgi:sulfite exporter TauE/SafE
MCGALAILSGQGGRARLQMWFHAGRLGVYALLGAAAGAVGHGLDTLGALAGVERVASLVAVLAVAVTFFGRAKAAPRLAGPRALIMQLLRGVTSPSVRAGMLGLVTAFVPCGWLYLWVATAAATGGVLQGAAVMVVLGLGAMPALLGANRLATWLRRGPLARHPRIVAAGAIAVLLCTVTLRGVAVAQLHRAFAARPSSVAVPLVCHGGSP